MLFPIGDDNPSRTQPLLTWTLIGLNVAVFLVLNVPRALSGDEHALAEIFVRWGFDQTQPLSVQLLTSMFVHAGLAHLVGNMWMLWIVGDNVEDKLGRLRFGLLYVLGGVVAAWAYVLTSQFTSDVGAAIGAEATATIVPLVGASGAIFAIMGTYLVFFPQARIRLLLWVVLFVQILPVRAKWIIGAWIVQDLVLTVIVSGPAAGSVATAAHVGGAVFGVAVGVWLKPRVGGGGAGDAWDVHTGFASANRDGHRAPWRRGWRVAPVAPTESQLVDIEQAIVRDVRSGRIDAALDLYPRYEAMDREMPLPGPVQIEIAHELFRRGLPTEAYEAYQRYLETEPRGADAVEACFRIGVLLARAFGRVPEAAPYLLRAAQEHPDPSLRAFANNELTPSQE